MTIRRTVIALGLTAVATLGVLGVSGLLPTDASTTEPAGERLEMVSRMRMARAAHTATTISGDRVLVAGGMKEGGAAIRRFEVYDARRDAITANGDMSAARATHTATLLPDGRVLVAGGYTGEYLKSAEIFDPRTGRFLATGSMSEGRAGQTATLLADGTVLVTGGVGDGWTFLSSAELYDPRTGRFKSVGSMRWARESHTASRLSDGRVLVIGGHRDRRANITVYASTELYDPTTRSFSAGPNLRLARHKHDAVTLLDGRVLVIGGSDRRDSTQYSSAEVYDPVSREFRYVGRMSAARYKLRDTAIRLNDGRVLITGSGRFAELFDPRNNTFSRVPGEFSREYSFASSALLSTGDVLVFGGYDDSMRNTDGIWRFRH